MEYRCRYNCQEDAYLSMRVNLPIKMESELNDVARTVSNEGETA